MTEKAIPGAERLSRLVLAVCLLASFACVDDHISINLDAQPLTVTVMTSGENLDADGYTLSITGVPNEPIGINESKVFSVLKIDITVELQGIAANCVVADNTRTVNISGPTTMTFGVECSNSSQEVGAISWQSLGNLLADG